MKHKDYRGQQVSLRRKKYRLDMMVLPFAVATCLFSIPGIAMAQNGMPNATQQTTIRQPAYQHIHTRPSMLPPLDPGDPPPPSGSSSQDITLNAFDLNTQKHQATIKLSNGFVAIIDGSKEKVILKYAGKTATVSLDKALLKWPTATRMSPTNANISSWPNCIRKPIILAWWS